MLKIKIALQLLLLITCAAEAAPSKKISEQDFKKTYLKIHRDICLKFSEGKGNTKKLLDILNYGYKYSQHRYMLEDTFNINQEVLRNCTDVATAITLVSIHHLSYKIQFPIEKRELFYKLKRHINYRILMDLSWEEYEQSFELDFVNLKRLEREFKISNKLEKEYIVGDVFVHFNTYGLKNLEEIYSK